VEIGGLFLVLSRSWFSTGTKRFLDCCSFSSPSFEGLFEGFSGNRIVLSGNLLFLLNLRLPSTSASSKRYSSLVVVFVVILSGPALIKKKFKNYIFTLFELL